MNSNFNKETNESTKAFRTRVLSKKQNNVKCSIFKNVETQ